MRKLLCVTFLVAAAAFPSAAFDRPRLDWWDSHRYMPHNPWVTFAKDSAKKYDEYAALIEKGEPAG